MSGVFVRLGCLSFVLVTTTWCGSENAPTDPPTEPQTAAIQGFVRIGSTPIEGVQVLLTGPGGQRTIRSAADGGFAFSDLQPGVYVMRAILAGVTCSSTSAEMRPGETVTASINCASAAPQLATSITGRVLEEFGGSVAPLGEIQVTLTGVPYDGGDPIERAVTTDSNGRYTFAQSPPGTYGLTASAPGFACESVVVFLVTGPPAPTVAQDITCTAVEDGEAPPPPPMLGLGRIAFERHGRIMVLDLDTNDLSHFVDGLAPSWSPDGSRLAFQRPACLDRSVPPGAPCDDIWVVNADGSGLSAVTSYEWVHDEDPVWSPDGSRLAFVRFVHGPDQSYLVVADVDPPSTLWSETVPSVWHPYSDPTWSPDGTQIAFTCEGPPPRWEFDLCAVPSFRNLGYQGGGIGGVLRITAGTAVDSDPAWSPDGTRIAFTTDREASGGSRVALVRTDGSGYEALVMGKDPAWSPDGTRIVFAGGDDAPGLHIVNRDGTGLVRITDDPADTAPSWGR